MADTVGFEIQPYGSVPSPQFDPLLIVLLISGVAGAGIYYLTRKKGK